jgi:purine nucleosidase
MEGTNVKRVIIIDTDPGQDDAVAILFALGAEDKFDIRALTTVAGNVPLELTSRNARIIRDLGDRTDIPVYAGCPHPMIQDLVTAEHIHGQRGIDGIDLPEPKAGLASGHAVNYLIEALRKAAPASVTLCLIGPQTNLATALVLAPDIKAGIKEIVAMAGAHFHGGNVTPSAEFNVYVDPHAADIVFRSGVPITILPLDVTHKARTSPIRMERLRNLGNEAGKLVADILTSYERRETEHFGGEGGPLHDPCAIGYLLDPTLFRGKKVNVSVELQGGLTLGETVVDWHGVTDRKLNAFWINEMDSDRFFARLTESIARLR